MSSISKEDYGSHEDIKLRLQVDIAVNVFNSRRLANHAHQETAGQQMKDIGVLKDQGLFELPSHLMQVEPVEAIGKGRHERQHQVPVKIRVFLDGFEGV